MFLSVIMIIFSYLKSIKRFWPIQELIETALVLLKV